MKLVDFLELYRISYHEFAEHINVNVSMVWRFCKKNSMPSLDVARKIAKATDGKVCYEDYFDEPLTIKPILPANVASAREMMTKFDELNKTHKEELEMLKAQIHEMQNFLTGGESIKSGNCSINACEVEEEEKIS
jgi:transcriptional regulator with XRE-family HTH domain